LFSRVFGAVTAGRESAVGSAGIWNDVRVESTVIALFVNIEATIATKHLARRTTFASSIAFFSKSNIHNSITTLGKLARDSTSVRNLVGVELPVITFFVAVNNIVTALSWLARSPACIASGVRIQSSVITLLICIQFSISAFSFTSFAATITIPVVSIITILEEAVIDHTIATRRKGTIGPALVGLQRIQGPLVTNFIGVNHTITTSGKSAIRSTPVWDGI